MEKFSFSGISMIGIVAVVIIAFVVFLVSRYRTVSPDKVLLVNGSYLGGGRNVYKDPNGGKMKIIRGGGTFVLPVFQKAQLMSLQTATLEVAVNDVYTKLGVPVSTHAVAIYKVGSSLEEIATAAEQYLGKSKEVMDYEVKEVLEGHLRAILGSMTVEDIYANREEFASKTQEVAQGDLDKLGLTVKSFQIKNISDENGYLDSLGKPQIAKVQRDAAIAQAEAKSETRIKEAEAEKLAQDIEIKRATEVAEAQKEQNLKIAEFKQEQDKARAIADNAYEVQKAKVEQETIAEQMKIEVIKREKQIELEEKEIIRKEREYDANVKKKADADRYSMEQEAQAHKNKQIAEAQAKAQEIHLNAEAESQAIATKAQAESERVAKFGEAEASAIEQKAKALKLMDTVGQLEMILNALPTIIAEAVRPVANIDSLTVFDGAQGVQDMGAVNLAQTFKTVEATTGLDIKGIIESAAGNKPIATAIEQNTLANDNQQKMNDQKGQVQEDNKREAPTKNKDKKNQQNKQRNDEQKKSDDSKEADKKIKVSEEEIE